MRNNNLNKNINNPVKRQFSYRTNNDKNMKKDFILPLITGILLGAMIMIFWQFNSRLNNVRSALVQLDQVTTQNSSAVNEIVNFINQATNNNPGEAQN